MLTCIYLSCTIRAKTFSYKGRRIEETVPGCFSANKTEGSRIFSLSAHLRALHMEVAKDLGFI